MLGQTINFGASEISQLSSNICKNCTWPSYLVEHLWLLARDVPAVLIGHSEGVSECTGDVRLESLHQPLVPAFIHFITMQQPCESHDHDMSTSIPVPTP